MSWPNVTAWRSSRSASRTGSGARFYIDRVRQWWICLGQCVAGGDALDLVGCQEYGPAWDARNPAMVRRALEILARDRPA